MNRGGGEGAGAVNFVCFRCSANDVADVELLNDVRGEMELRLDEPEFLLSKAEVRLVGEYGRVVGDLALGGLVIGWPVALVGLVIGTPGRLICCIVS